MVNLPQECFIYALLSIRYANFNTVELLYNIII